MPYAPPSPPLPHVRSEAGSANPGFVPSDHPAASDHLPQEAFEAYFPDTSVLDDVDDEEMEEATALAALPDTPDRDEDEEDEEDSGVSEDDGDDEGDDGEEEEHSHTEA